MQKSPQSSKPDFDQASQLTRQERVDHQMKQVNSERILKDYQALLDRQDDIRESELKRMESIRENDVKAITQKRLDERVKNISPVLEPKHLAGPDRNEQSRLARGDAEATVDYYDQKSLDALEGQFLSERERFADRATQRQDRMNQFQDAALKDGPSQQSQSGRESNQGPSEGRSL